MLLLSQLQTCTCAVFVRRPGVYKPHWETSDAYASTTPLIAERKEANVILGVVLVSF